MDSLITRAWKNYRVLQKGPESFESICEDVLSLTAKLRLVDESRGKIEVSASDEDTLEGIKDGCNAVFWELEAILARCRTNHGTLEDVTDVQREVLEKENDLNIFLETVRSHSQAKILTVLDQIRETRSREFLRSIVADWAILEAELQKLGLPKYLIEEEFFFIQRWLKEKYPADVPEEEALPGYSPGAQRGTIEEKVQALEQTSMFLRAAPVEQIASSSKTDPPPYTFDDGADTSLDDTFSAYIDAAIRTEANFRATQRIDHSELGAHPWSWLPPSLQHQYSTMYVGEVVPIMAADSFSVMAYGTAPRCVTEIERLKRLLKSTSDQKTDAPNETIDDASHSLEVMSDAMQKFPLLQEQSSSVSRLSDLDVFDYESSTARAADSAIGFPSKEFELAQKGYYRLLTYVMGFLNAFASLYPGRTYVTRSPTDIDFSWKALRMNTRAAWVEKQLVGWEPIKKAALFCRNFHRLNPGLRSQAIKALQDWQVSERILSGVEPYVVELRIIGAFSLPKSSFRVPTTWVKVVFYGPNKYGGPFRKFELKTDSVQKTQDPVWNKTFKLDIPPDARMIDLELYDRVAGLTDKELSRVRLKFSSIPGVEATLADRSLIYGIDEDIDYPLTILDGKGKETESPILRIGLKWEGRQAKVQELGLPIRPPGKMFRLDFVGIPLSPDQRAAKISGMTLETTSSRGSKAPEPPRGFE